MTSYKPLKAQEYPKLGISISAVVKKKTNAHNHN